jgi:hypothetical protein
MKHYLTALVLAMPIAAFAGNVFTSTPHEAHDMADARNICNWKANMFVQAYDDRNSGIPYDTEIRRLRAVTENAVAQGARLEPSDIDDLVQMAYSSSQPIWQVQTSIMQACMTPFSAGFEATQTPYWLNQ